jgi:hypothetical protein
MNFDGFECATAEHAYQLAKFIYPGCSAASTAYAQRIAAAKTPYMAKLLGNQKCGGRFEWQKRLQEVVDEYKAKGVRIDPNWDARKEDVMRSVLLKKFRHDAVAFLVLRATEGRPLEEASPYDRYWGTGRDGTGRNRLGHLLAEVREQLLAEKLASNEG